MYRKHRRAPRKRTEILVNVTSRRCRNSNRASFFPCSSASLSSRPRPRILPVSLSFCVAQARAGANQPITNPRPTEPNIPRHLHTLFTPPAFSSYRITRLATYRSANIVRPLLIGFIFAAQTEERPTVCAPQPLNAVSTNPTIANFSTL